MRKSPILLLSFTILIITSACGESRTEQCQRLGNAANEAQQEFMAVRESGIGGLAYNPELERKVAQVTQQGAENIAAVELSDSELEEIRDRMVQAYEQTSEIAKQTAEITPANGRPSPALEKQIDNLQMQSFQGLPTAIQDLEIYCIGG